MMPVPAETAERAAERAAGEAATEAAAEAAGRRNFLRMMRHFAARFRTQAG
jgi:hypothetical protein